MILKLIYLIVDFKVTNIFIEIRTMLCFMGSDMTDIDTKSGYRCSWLGCPVLWTFSKMARDHWLCTLVSSVLHDPFPVHETLRNLDLNLNKNEKFSFFVQPSYDIWYLVCVYIHEKFIIMVDISIGSKRERSRLARSHIIGQASLTH
jgi:hypothetical protein